MLVRIASALFVAALLLPGCVSSSGDGSTQTRAERLEARLAGLGESSKQEVFETMNDLGFRPPDPVEGTPEGVDRYVFRRPYETTDAYDQVTLTFLNGRLTAYDAAVVEQP